MRRPPGERGRRLERRIEVDPTRGSAGREPFADESETTRADALSAASLNLLAGVWLIISPWVLGYTHADARWNPVIFGAIVAVLAFTRIVVRADTAALSAVNAAIGVWLFIAGFWLADSGQAAWNDWILGVIVFVVAMTGLASGPRRSFIT